MRITEVLRDKGDGVVTITPDQPVRALVVSPDGEHVLGIASERDVVRHLRTSGAALLDAPVESIMTAEVHTCTPQATLEELMTLMTDRRVRHVPVMVEDRLCGLVSIGDVVKHRMGELQSERDQLTAYITG
jgi:CBS domain-containing protein